VLVEELHDTAKLDLNLIGDEQQPQPALAKMLVDASPEAVGVGVREPLHLGDGVLASGTIRAS
jgi:hypothetical protein